MSALEVEADDNAAQRVSTEDVELFSADPVNAGEAIASAETVDADEHSGNGLVTADDRVSKKDLVQLLEGFVSILKSDANPSAQAVGSDLAPLRFDVRGGSARMSEVQVDDRTAEIESLRNLVIEAQDTIIKLLTDRVEDRARIAGLEAQVNILPDLQAQADRAMMVAVRTEEYRSELTKVKFELDRFRLHRVRAEAEKKKGSIFTRVQRWLLSRPLFHKANSPDADAQVLRGEIPPQADVVNDYGSSQSGTEHGTVI